jgi:hypothetical protein
MGKSFAAGLRCFQHPLVWLSIALLLLNDHLLKAIAPSWLTGKLSDFAGLFFFPLLLAAGLGLVLDRLRCPARLTWVLSFALTGIGFVLLKTVPAANVLAVQVASRLLGAPVRYALDPTDLLALAALVPAWWLWNHPPAAAPRRAARVVLFVGALASLATSPQERYSADRITHVDGLLYTMDLESNGLAGSGDGGRSWGVLYGNAGLPSIHFHDVSFPLVACDPAVPQECFRITGAEAVEASTDGGATWRVDWSIPAGRRDFLQRYHSPTYYGAQATFVPCDLDMFTYAGDRYLLVAMGDEGIMRRRLPDGAWERLSVDGAFPTPYAVTEYTLLYVHWEATMALVLAQLTLLGSGLLVCWTLRKRLANAVDAPRPTWHVLRPVVIAAPVAMLVLLLFAASGIPWDLYTPNAGIIVVLLLALGLAAPLFGFGMTSQRITNALGNPRPAEAAVRTGLGTALAVLLAGTLPWIMWVDGTIPFYYTALGIVALLVLATLGGGLALVWAIARRGAE